ncbi:MAG: type IV pilin protein [Prochloraceae cyanobacterium]
MKTTLKARLLQHLVAKKKDKGFTLVELLVVVIIIGILSAIALPSLLNQSNKAKESEATQAASSVNKQQALQVTEKGQFTTSFDTLALGNLQGGAVDADSSKYYTYTITTADQGSGATLQKFAYITTAAKDLALKNVGGGIVRELNNSGQAVTKETVCKATEAGVDATITDVVPDATNNTDQCTGDLERV